MRRRLSPLDVGRVLFFCLIASLGAASRSRAQDASDPPAAPSPPGSSPRPLSERIDRAIDRGREALRPRLIPLIEDPRSDYPIGRIAFVLAALLQAGVSPSDPVVARALETLSSLEPTKTYCVASYLILLGALSDRVADARESRAGSPAPGAAGAAEPERPAGPVSELEIRGRMEELAEWLVSARTLRRGSWTYEAGTRTRTHDFSNTQFAVLGLHVALEHGIAIPAEVFSEIVRLFSASIQLEASPFTLTYRPVAGFEAVLGLEPRPGERRTRVRPGGWAYRVTSSRAAAKPPYAAMTAAGASSVIVATQALRTSRARSSQRFVKAGEKTLHQSYAWIEKHFDEFVADGPNLYYTLYSLEKVGDLGGIAAFGDRDWYVDGCRLLLGKQRKNGSWGSYVDTSLALLFLTRATRPMDAAAAPTLVTRGGRENDDEADEADEAAGEAMDLVYIDRAKGFLSARELLGYAAETRDPRLVEIGEEVVRNYDPLRREELIPPLLDLWTKRTDRVTAFARRALVEITGESFESQDDARQWYAGFLEIRALEELDEIDAAELTKRLRKLESPVLRSRLVRLVRRRNMHALTGELGRELERTARLRTPAAASYRRVLHGVLSLWCASGIRAPASDSPKAWKRTAEEWARWLREGEP